jgi:hypothetical protein
MTEIFYDKNAESDGDGEKQDLGVYEARRLIGPKSYDDNWNLTRYTSELRNEKDNSFYAFVDFGSENEGTIRECPHCLTFEVHNKLGPKIKKDYEPPAPDDEMWMSCYECGNTFAAHETFPESQIKNSLETVSNPFESNESVFLSTDSRATQRRKRELKDHRTGVHKYRSKRIDYEIKDDPEIQAEIDRHVSDNVHIIQ